MMEYFKYEVNLENQSIPNFIDSHTSKHNPTSILSTSASHPTRSSEMLEH